MARGPKSHIRPNVSGALDDVPRPPSWLSSGAKSEWKRVAPILVERRILTDADLGTLESYCVAIGTVRECAEILKRDGLIVTGGLGGAKRHPASTAQAAAQNSARQLASELGLTPVSRNRPAVREDSDYDDDPLNIS